MKNRLDFPQMILYRKNNRRVNLLEFVKQGGTEMKKKFILTFVLSIFLLFTLTLLVQSNQDEVPLIPTKGFFRILKK